jgi:hypothetical protein
MNLIREAEAHSTGLNKLLNTGPDSIILTPQKQSVM